MIIMDNKTILEVLSRLIGYTEPTGNAKIDKTRDANNSALIYITYNCIEQLIDNSRSISKIGQDSYNALNNIVDMIVDSGTRKDKINDI